jgi:transposase-like protein
MKADIHCPRCNSDALYKYGRTGNCKQRYICQVCNRQFVLEKSRMEVKTRPTCPSCSKPMHLYMRNGLVTRFRCSDYPKCRTYLKLTSDSNKPSSGS